MSMQDYMYEVLDQDTMPGGRSIWIIDMKGELNHTSNCCSVVACLWTVVLHLDPQLSAAAQQEPLACFCVSPFFQGACRSQRVEHLPASMTSAKWDKPRGDAYLVVTKIFLVWAGVGLTDLGSEAMEISKSFAGIVAAHYPERLYRLELLPAAHLQLFKILHTTETASRHLQLS